MLNQKSIVDTLFFRDAFKKYRQIHIHSYIYIYLATYEYETYLHCIVKHDDDICNQIYLLSVPARKNSNCCSSLVCQFCTENGSRTIIDNFLNDATTTDTNYIVQYMECTHVHTVYIQYIYLLFFKCIFYVDELLLQSF